MNPLPFPAGAAIQPAWWLSADVFIDSQGAFTPAAPARIAAPNLPAAKHIYITETIRTLCGEKLPFLQIFSWRLCVPAD